MICPTRLNVWIDAEFVSKMLPNRYVDSQGFLGSLYGGIYVVECQEVRAKLQIIVQVKRPASFKSCLESRHTGWLYGRYVLRRLLVSVLTVGVLGS